MANLSSGNTGKINMKIIAILLFVIIIGFAFYPSSTPVSNSYIERDSGVIKTEKVLGEKWLSWLYGNPVGEASMYILVKRKFFSSIYGNMMDWKSSVEKIKPFVDEYNIDMDIVENQEYNSFNDFFTRKLKMSARPIDSSINVVVSPADGKILAYADLNYADFIVKGVKFDVSSFLDDNELAKKYENGSLFVIRLAPYDYHRFHFPVGGTVSQPVLIDGDLYSVNPIALRQMIDIFFINKREYVSISTAQFGKVIMAEVGATMVGSIVQTYNSNNVKIGEEKGYFKFGGSTVVLIFEKDKIVIDDDLLKNTAAGLETEVKMGEKIANLWL